MIPKTIKPQLSRLRRSAKRGLSVWLLMLPLVLAVTVDSIAELPPPPKQLSLTNEFFAMDTGVHGAGLKTPEDKVKLLKELGYAGIGWTPPGVAEMLTALDQQGLKMSSLYIGANIGENEQKYDPQLPKQIELLKGQGTIIWLHISSKSHQTSAPEGDERAVAIIREVAALAEASGLQVALYPHAGAWLERVQDALRVVKKVDRANVGLTFNLCHCLKVGDEKKIPELLKECRPHLFVVTINGADHEGGWNRLIQPLDQGSFDVAEFLLQLQAVNFNAPIGLQHYGVKGDARENLRRSKNAWQKFSSR